MAHHLPAGVVIYWRKRLAITRERRLIGIYTEQLAKTDGFIVAEYKSLTVARSQ
jgi:hypothetical protein